jgi:pimeloyl-ACP methyl ester carboxylesterase
MNSSKIQYKSLIINSVKIAYREAGKIGSPVLFLLHGFPSSSHMFRNIIPRLSNHFHVIAPDLPGFGFSEIPRPDEFDYTFENYSKLIADFLEQLNISKVSFYLFDYGAPILMRLLVRRPEMIEMLIFQNGNIFNEGVGDVLKDITRLLVENTSDSLLKVKPYFEYDYTKWEYLNGVQDVSSIAVESYTLDQLLMDRDGVKEIQIQLKSDYKTNIALYPEWQDTLQQLQPVTLIVWGENDEVFKKEGALKLNEILDRSKLIFYPTGHFALEEFGEDIAEEIITYWHLHFN